MSIHYSTVEWNGKINSS